MKNSLFIFVVLVFVNISVTKDVDVGPYGQYSTIEEAVTAEMPLTEDLDIHVSVPQDGYITPTEIDADALSLNGFAINILGTISNETLIKKTIYYDGGFISEFDLGNAELKEYMTFGNSQVEGRIEVDATDRYYFYIKDHLGSIVGTISGDQLIDANKYALHGEINKVVESGYPTREKFTGKELDEDGVVTGFTEGMGLYYFGARYFDPVVGLWISTDPEKQFFSYYSYATNPINFIDPDGRAIQWAVIGVIALKAATAAAVELSLQYAMSGGDNSQIRWGGVVAAGFSGAITTGIDMSAIKHGWSIASNSFSAFASRTLLHNTIDFSLRAGGHIYDSQKHGYDLNTALKYQFLANTINATGNLASGGINKHLMGHKYYDPGFQSFKIKVDDMLNPGDFMKRWQGNFMNEALHIYDFRYGFSRDFTSSSIVTNITESMKMIKEKERYWEQGTRR